MYFRRINSAKEDFLNSNVYQSFKALLTESLLLLNNPKIEEIVCLGLGSIGECIISRYQFAVLLYLKERFNVNVLVCDPILTKSECDILKEFDCQITENIEGKHSVKKDLTTVFYLPHCPKQLTNNLLWKNWGLQLSNCLLIANSFDKIVETNTKKALLENASYISTILPHTTELTIINEFKYYGIFSDISIHVFPMSKLSFLPQDFWELHTEPKYAEEDIEFITNNFEQKVNL